MLKEQHIKESTRKHAGFDRGSQLLPTHRSSIKSENKDRQGDRRVEKKKEKVEEVEKLLKGEQQKGVHSQNWESGENGLNITTTVAGKVQR